MGDYLGGRNGSLKGAKTVEWKEQCDKFDHVDMGIFFFTKRHRQGQEQPSHRVGECFLLVKSANDWYQHLKNTTILEFKKEDSTRYSKSEVIRKMQFETITFFFYLTDGENGKI